MADPLIPPSPFQGEGRGEEPNHTAANHPSPLPDRERELCGRVIIVHTLEQAMAALAAATELHTPVTLQSAPDAIFYAGSLYLLNLFQQAQAAYPRAQAHCILDCADTGAEAVEALRIGHRLVRTAALPEMRRKIADIATALGATLMDGPYEALDLRHARNVEKICKEWLFNKEK